MAVDKKNNKNKNVDDAGIRLAPTPIQNAGFHVMPTVMQELVIEPRIEVGEQNDDGSLRAPSTASDYQPKKQDQSRKWKRRKRNKNIVIGSIMLFVTIVMALPMILDVAGAKLNLGLQIIPERYGAISGLVNAIKGKAYVNGVLMDAESSSQAWLFAIPNLVILAGALGMVLNVIKAIIAIIGKVRPVEYALGAGIYFVFIVVVFIAALIGVKTLGMAVVEINGKEMGQLILDIKQSALSCDLLIQLILSAAYLVVSSILTAIGSDRNGY